MLGQREQIRRTEPGSQPGGESPLDLDSGVMFQSPPTYYPAAPKSRQLVIRRACLIGYSAGIPESS
ncbi:MAG: hypothetical protein HY329_14560 [Chloroflexi bacterium]|nr:hypothetical protein [Chloroflexota bacterium]